MWVLPPLPHRVFFPRNAYHSGFATQIFTVCFMLPKFCHKNVNHLAACSDCYETIMFGRVTHALDAGAMGVRSFVYVIHIL